MKHQRLIPLLAAAGLLVAGCHAGTPSLGGSDATGSSTSAAGFVVTGPPVTITVNCEPPTTTPGPRADWVADVSAFEKLHPNITVVSKDENPCDDPNTFDAKLASGQEENVFYVYLTDAANVIASGQAADIQSYASSIPGLSDIQPSLTNVFRKGGTASGDLYGLPRSNYTMGLIYNRTLFSQAGLDPNAPPTTWAEVRADAKKIAALGNGDVGYGEYSAGNTGGWHFTAEMYSRGGRMTTPNGKTQDFDNATGEAVLQNLKTMRWTDNSMGQKQLLQYSDLIKMMASGKLGMYIGAPDNITAIVTQYKGSYANLGMGPMPGPAGQMAKGTLLGGDGYMFNKSDTPAQIKAGLLWLEYENLTPGQGQFNYSRMHNEGLPVGLPEPDIFQGAATAKDASAKNLYATIPISNFQPYINDVTKIPGVIEPPQAQAIYKVMDSAMSAILTNQSSTPSQVLAQYAPQVNAVLANSQ